LLESRYRSEVFESDGQHVTLRLEKAPVSEHAAAETVEVVLRQPDCRPVSLQLTDAVGSVTRMELADLELDTVLAERLFHFEVPAGVDLIEEPAASAPEAASPTGVGAEGGPGR
jgi:outer membrane lipoprotein-sorting protein